MFIPADIIETTLGADLAVQLEFEEVDGVPLIWLELEIVIADTDHHRVSIFLNILDDQAVSCYEPCPTSAGSLFTGTMKNGSIPVRVRWNES